MIISGHFYDRPFYGDRNFRYLLRFFVIFLIFIQELYLFLISLALAETENTESESGENKSLLEDFQNECVSIFDFKHAESVKDETKGGDKQPDYERKFVFWNETKKFQRKLRLAQQGNFHQNSSL